jgi:hypothetical protein
MSLKMTSNQTLPFEFAVYVEKFDSELTNVKMSGSEWDEVRAGLLNIFCLEKSDVQMILFDKCEKHWFNSEQGFAIFFMKCKFAQDFTIRAINENLRLAGIKARGPRTSQLALQDHNYVATKIEEQFPKEHCKASSTEIVEIILPEEVWILIWSYLDFNIVQKICSLVSKSWLEMIRSSKLSWEMKLQIIYYKDDMDVIALRDFNSILFHWNNLRVLHFSSEPEFARFRTSLSLNSHESLEKIVIPAELGLRTKGSNLYHNSCGVVTKYWIDPRHVLAPDAVKNVVALKIYLEGLPDDIGMTQNDCDLTNLETLEISQYPFSQEENFVPTTELLSKFKNLKELVMCLEMNIDFLPHIVFFLGNTNNLNISGTVEVWSDYIEEETKEIFNEGLKILREKFPFPDRRILDLKIFENEEYYDTTKTTYSITYGENGATLITSENNSDSENENSDSMHESDEDSESFVVSDENSDSMVESDEHSDDEDMNVQEL